MRFLCPTCKKTLEGTRNQFPTLPFCSPRCRAADLGNWLNESYRIGSPANEEDLDEGLPPGVDAARANDRN
jgi:uncharacterized protein